MKKANCQSYLIKNQIITIEFREHLDIICVPHFDEQFMFCASVFYLKDFLLIAEEFLNCGMWIYIYGATGQIISSQKRKRIRFLPANFGIEPSWQDPVRHHAPLA